MDKWGAYVHVYADVNYIREKNHILFLIIAHS